MKRLKFFLAAEVLVLLSATGCQSNPLVGRWQKSSGGSWCGDSLSFTSTQETHNDAAPTPGDAVTYTVEDKVVYVRGTGMATPWGHPIPYNIIDKDHITWVSSMGAECQYTRAR